MILVLLLLVVPSANAAETLDLVTPVTRATVGKWRVESLFLAPGVNEANPTGPLVAARCAITVNLISDAGTRIEHAYSGSTCLTLIGQLNTANLSTASLQRRVLLRLQADGVIAAGSVSGTPD